MRKEMTLKRKQKDGLSFTDNDTIFKAYQIKYPFD